MKNTTTLPAIKHVEDTPYAVLDHQSYPEPIDTKGED